MCPCEETEGGRRGAQTVREASFPLTHTQQPTSARTHTHEQREVGEETEGEGEGETRGREREWGRTKPQEPRVFEAPAAGSTHVMSRIIVPAFICRAYAPQLKPHIHVLDQETANRLFGKCELKVAEGTGTING